MSARPITLLTDFGTRDGYVAALKGVIATHSPESIIHDASHEIDPGDVVSAAFALRRYWMLFPRETVHVVVVDPGVGSTRAPIAVRANDRYLVGPDNGVLVEALRDAENWQAFALSPEQMMLPPASSTFHGRDIFAPAAARLAAGRAIGDLGQPIENLVELEVPKPSVELDYVEGEVVYVDRFGNLVTNITAASVPPNAKVQLNGNPIGPLRDTYANAASGAAVAVINSERLIEIAVRDGSAARNLGAGRGAKVRAQG